MKNLFFLLLLFSFISHADVFVVDLYDFDIPDVAPGDGDCSIGLEDLCSLRAAVMEANANPGFDTIFISGSTPVTLTREGSGEDDAFWGDLDITETVWIGSIAPIGNEALFPTIHAENFDRVFDVHEGAGDVTFSNFRIQGGNVSGGPAFENDGGAIRLATGVDVSVSAVWFFDNLAVTGGAIFLPQSSTLTVTNSVFTNNAATVTGSAITSFGVVEISQSTILGNINSNADVDSHQEAIFMGDTFAGNNSHLIMNNTTMYDNNETGIFSQGGDVSLRNVTIANHTDAGVRVQAGSGAAPTLLMNNSILDNNSVGCAHEAEVNTTLDRFNISSDFSCLFFSSTNLIEDPKLTSLKIDANGWHRYLRPGFFSPVKDSANSAEPGVISTACLVEDQLGLDRSTDGGDRCDRGAIELSSDVIYFDDYDIQYDF